MLKDMPIDYTNVIYGLSEHKTNAPPVPPPPTQDPPTGGTPTQGGFDGTSYSITPCSAAVSFIEFLADMATKNTHSWWTGWWPVLHTVTSGLLDSGATYILQMGVDLLGTVTLEFLNLNTPADDNLSDYDLQMMAAQSHENFWWDVFMASPAGTLLGIAATCNMAIDVLVATLTKCPTLAQLAVLIALEVSFVLLMIYALQVIFDGIFTGEHTAADALNMLFWAIAIMGMDAYLSYLNVGTLWAKYWQMRGTTWAKLRVPIYLGLVVFSAFMKILLFGMMLGTFLKCTELWILGY